jgi:hypothetical protein
MAIALLIFSGSWVVKAEVNLLKITIKKMRHDKTVVAWEIHCTKRYPDGSD